MRGLDGEGSDFLLGQSAESLISIMKACTLAGRTDLEALQELTAFAYNIYTLGQYVFGGAAVALTLCVCKVGALLK